jgi:hypothetical protein
MVFIGVGSSLDVGVRDSHQQAVGSGDDVCHAPGKRLSTKKKPRRCDQSQSGAVTAGSNPALASGSGSGHIVVTARVTHKYLDDAPVAIQPDNEAGGRSAPVSKKRFSGELSSARRNLAF